MMHNPLDRTWRLLATAFSFAVFGVAALVVAIIIVPLLAILVSDPMRQRRLARHFIHRLFQLFIGLLQLLGVISVEIMQPDKLQQSGLILANHPTLIDVFFLLAVIPNANCVVKKSLTKNPFTSAAIKAAGYIVNQENPYEVLAEADLAFQQGETLIVFPEGTRSRLGQAIKLKGGAAIMAVRANVDVTPVTIQCAPLILTKGAAWYHIPEQKPHFIIQVQDAIAISDYRLQTQPRLAARSLTSDLTHYMNKELGRYE